jgi:hypothetical protein
LNLRQMEAFWYQFLLCTEDGANLFKQQPIDFVRYLLDKMSPRFHLTDDAFAELSESFGNPQFADAVIHYYRHRWHVAQGFSSYSRQEALLDTMPQVRVPTIFVCGDIDGANLAESSRASESFFE